LNQDGCSLIDAITGDISDGSGCWLLGLSW